MTQDGYPKLQTHADGTGLGGMDQLWPALAPDERATAETDLKAAISRTVQSLKTAARKAAMDATAAAEDAAKKAAAMGALARSPPSRRPHHD